MARDGERGRGDWKARRGSRNSGPYAEGNGGESGPVDIAAVRHDDALIDAISGNGPVQTDSEQEFQLATLLADWRAELLAPPLPSSPDLDEVAAAVNQEIGARKVRVGAQAGGHLRLVRPILGTAAALALVFGGVTAFSYNAEPGNPLWKVKEVVFSEQAQTTVVNRAVGPMGEAQQAIDKSNPTQAAAQLGKAKDAVDQVSDSGKKAELDTEWKRLVNELRVSSAEGARLAALLDPPTDPADPTGSTSTPPPVTSITTAPVTPGGESTTKPDPRSSSGSESSTTPEPSATLPTTPSPVDVEPPTAPTTVPSTAVPTTTIVTPPTQVTPTAGGDVTIPTQPQQTVPSIPGTTATFTIPNVPSLPGTN
ncbi:anti-sigma-D factor RsdA [Nocardia sp. NPDC127579]|uniref:anti-sigma-D factor RsdA n=1 Tax=Nocardia sp. NPDC127579 TaxID=3345402 RepID=UPI00363FC740